MQNRKDSVAPPFFYRESEMPIKSLIPADPKVREKRVGLLFTGLKAYENLFARIPGYRGIAVDVSEDNPAEHCAKILCLAVTDDVDLLADAIFGLPPTLRVVTAEETFDLPVEYTIINRLIFKR